MNQQQILEALAQVLGATQETAKTLETSPEIEAAKAARKNKIQEVANEIANDLYEVFEKYDFDTKVAVQLCNAMVTPFISVKDQFFWSVDRADKAAQRLARMQATGQWEDDARGGMKDASDDGQDGTAEISPMRQAEDAVKYHQRNAEQYEILTQAVNRLWCRYEMDLAADDQEVGFVPDFELSEKKLQEYISRQQQRSARSSRSLQVQADAQAARIDRETSLSFLS